MATEIEVAWAAGVFEGEGCIRHTKVPHNGTCRRLMLGMTDKDIVNRFVSIVGSGSVCLTRTDIPNRKPMWQWNLSKWSEVERVLRMFLPYFGERRKAKALELLADPPTRGNGFCPRGHPVRGPDADVYQYGDHSPVCAVCLRAKAQEYRARKKVAA